VAITSFALHELGWHAFQQLCHTVLREILGQTASSFLNTNDGGRDGTFAGSWAPPPGELLDGEFVVQCKHTTRPGHNLTISQLDDELKKAAALAAASRCDIYVLMTNAGVTGQTERRIVAAFKRRGVKHVRVLGSTWLNQTIAESGRLRSLVPRLYGLGDLTQILDERAYRQARAVLDAMRADLAKLVLTGTHHRAARAVVDNGFVLLVGAPATGKTTIAAQLALGAADESGTAVVKLDTIGDLQDRWNPDERQLFWLDDAFGATQFDRSLARAWSIAVPRITSVVHAGGLFVLTSRDYVFHAAREHLKPGSFPLLNESQVVVDVADLTGDERRQILYNHQRHGRQPNAFVASVQPYLDAAADHPGFTPELARRFSDPLFTGEVRPDSAASVDDFFARPSVFLRDVMTGLDPDARAALGLIFINGNWVPSPIHLTPRDEDLLSRLGSHLGGVTQALASLAGSLMQNIVRDGESGWVFSHPTMVDAYADLLRTPELLHHFIAGFPLDVLLKAITCGDVGLRGAVVVPAANHDAVLDRLEEPLPAGDHITMWRARGRRTTFLATRCNRRFLQAWLERDTGQLKHLAHPGLMLEVVENNELVTRLNEYGLFPEDLRAEFARGLIEYCVTGIDPAVLWNERLRSTLVDSEQALLRNRVRDELLANPREALWNCTDGWDESRDPEEAVGPLRSLVHHLPRVFPDDPTFERATAELDQLLDEWVSDQGWEAPKRHRGHSTNLTERPSDKALVGSDRSVFDDLLDGRGLTT